MLSMCWQSVYNWFCVQVLKRCLWSKTWSKLAGSNVLNPPLLFQQDQIYRDQISLLRRTGPEEVCIQDTERLWFRPKKPGGDDPL